MAPGPLARVVRVAPSPLESPARAALGRAGRYGTRFPNMPATNRQSAGAIDLCMRYLAAIIGMFATVVLLLPH